MQMLKTLISHPHFAPLAFLLGGLILGYIVEKVLLTWLEKLAEKTTWEGDDIIVAAIRGTTLLWCVLLGAYASTMSANMPANALTLSHKLLMVIWIASATIVISRIAVGFAELYAKDTTDELRSTTILRTTIRIIIFGLGILIALQSLGISIAPILTALGVGGLAVALALQDTLSNLFAGIQIVVARQIRPGQRIRLDAEGIEGNIQDINWRTTIVVTPGNNSIIIPNSKISTAIVTNFHTPTQDLVYTATTDVAYGSDLDLVERVTREVAIDTVSTVEGGMPEFAPIVRFTDFGESGIKVLAIMKSRDFGSQFQLKHQFIKRLHARYAKEGIGIPYPTRAVIMQKP